MRIFNTLGRSVQDFEPSGSTVKMYVCGPTVYDEVHIGHGRTFVAYDMMSRYFKLKGYDVIRVQNITDIDDKIIKKSNETGKGWEEIVAMYSNSYLESLELLKVKIDLHPRVSQHVKDIIDFVSRLIEKGKAYVAESGSVYFDVDTYDKYGELSNTMKNLWNQGEETIKEKRHSYDFALWKASKPNEPFWESPWGRGRPGWHIECSTMSTRYLGETFDIHGGGMDLIFPHHENERAQSESLIGHPWVKYWVHTAFITIKKEKMSKSLGNIIPLKDALKEWGPSTLRLWFLSSHYRSNVDFSDETMEQAKSSIERFHNALAILRSVLREGNKFYSSQDGIRTFQKVLTMRQRFYQALDDDFDTPSALASIHDLASLIFTEIQQERDFLSAVTAMDLMRDFNQVFGVLDDELESQGKHMNTLVENILEVRKNLREKKMYEASDLIRDALAKSGIKIMDSKEGSTWRLE
ncbi:Cysteine--tRNA ligase [Sulfuracidifex tepidarius]|uniref:Cysteine--tRNA ligase n=1 Tax=Sulfuracidifex tepidarius TaxID=1294262 RepID=A0A510DYW7_9CREN|nr:cysteine--tRNA ligase [Sulfuracidifex tepidarius]BBG25377.1 Cysteine--tRNA ligase [Sulfuracidifex tepidarius]